MHDGYDLGAGPSGVTKTISKGKNVATTLTSTEPRALDAPRPSKEEAWYFTVLQQRALNVPPLLGPNG